MGVAVRKPEFLREHVQDPALFEQLTDFQKGNAALKAEYTKITKQINDQGLDKKIESFDDLKRLDELAAVAIVTLAKKTEALKMEGRNFGFFGLISTGKSSIINKLIGSEVAEVGAGETTTKLAGYKGTNFSLFDVPGRSDELSYFSMEYISFWKGLTRRLVVITSTLKEMTKVFSLLDAINLKYDIIINKFDNVPNDERETFKEKIRKESQSLGLKGVQQIWFVSAKNPAQFDWIKMVDHLMTMNESETIGKVYEARHMPNDIREVNSMVEKLLPYLDKDAISSISDSICKVAGIAVLESDEHSRSIVFGYGKYKLNISVDTLVQLVENECLREVDLLLPENERPDLKGKSRKEILDILASGCRKDDENLIECLTRWEIEHIVSPYTKHIFVRNFTGRTISKIGELVLELQTDLTISGGGPCEYLLSSTDKTEQSPTASSTQEYRQRIANIIRVRNVKIGVIDSGCSLLLSQQLIEREGVVMHNKMISAVNASRAIETDYHDCYFDGTCTGHGTGVVEIIANCVLSDTKIYVANMGYEFGPSNVECAMIELFKRGVDVLNCSFCVRKSQHLATTLEAIKSVDTGIIVVAAAGNLRYDSDSLNDGSTIMVGSHNDENSISTFSTAQCRANICSRGEGVYISSVQPNFRDGTSFATPNVTASVANVLSFISSLAADLRRNLQLSAQDLRCECYRHKGREVNLKFHPEAFELACLTDVVH